MYVVSIKDSHSKPLANAIRFLQAWCPLPKILNEADSKIDCHKTFLMTSRSSKVLDTVCDYLEDNYDASLINPDMGDEMSGPKSISTFPDHPYVVVSTGLEDVLEQHRWGTVEKVKAVNRYLHITGNKVVVHLVKVDSLQTLEILKKCADEHHHIPTADRAGHLAFIQDMINAICKDPIDVTFALSFDREALADYCQSCSFDSIRDFIHNLVLEKASQRKKVITTSDMDEMLFERNGLKQIVPYDTIELENQMLKFCGLWSNEKSTNSKKRRPDQKFTSGWGTGDKEEDNPKDKEEDDGFKKPAKRRKLLSLEESLSQ